MIGQDLHPRVALVIEEVFLAVDLLEPQDQPGEADVRLGGKALLMVGGDELKKGIRVSYPLAGLHRILRPARDYPVQVAARQPA